MELFAGRVLLTPGGGEVNPQTELAASVVGLYFAAGWCKPCTQFTPTLIHFYNQLQERNSHFKIVYISSDHSDEEMHEFLATCPKSWLHLPFDDPLNKSVYFLK